MRLAQPCEVESQIEELIQEWDSSKKDFEAILRFHSKFENIHPFQDGNGRIGRFLILKQCLENGVDLIMIDDAYSQEYKAALYQAQKNQDYEELKKVLQACQGRLKDKLEFLQQTLDYIQKYNISMKE